MEVVSMKGKGVPLVQGLLFMQGASDGGGANWDAVKLCNEESVDNSFGFLCCKYRGMGKGSTWSSFD